MSVKLSTVNRALAWTGFVLVVGVDPDGVEPTRLSFVFVGWLDQDAAWARHCERTRGRALP